MGDGFTSTAASSIADLAAERAVKAANYTFNSAYQRYTPEQLVTNQLSRRENHESSRLWRDPLDKNRRRRG